MTFPSFSVDCSVDKFSFLLFTASVSTSAVQGTLLEKRFQLSAPSLSTKCGPEPTNDMESRRFTQIGLVARKQSEKKLFCLFIIIIMVFWQ